MDRENQWLTLIANLGVIAGLVFLGFEIRQNTNIAMADAYRENVQDIAEWRELTITNPDLSRLYRTYLRQGMQAVDEAERGRIDELIYNVMGSYENAFFARNYGIIGDEEWSRFQFGACIHYTTARENQLSLPFITAKFRKFLNEVCKSDDQ
ncbi:MAG: hypothetical protein IH812_09640 [Proteobacteria bacterium]|nr:hypothetical protein [Pseudomonadota bacterium]